MRISSLSLGAVISACGALFCSASPVKGLMDLLIPKDILPKPPVEPRQLIDCKDMAAEFDESCWATLGLSDYLLDPVTGWAATTRTCSTVADGTDSDGSDCCKGDEPWSKCFLRLAHGVAGSDCSEINAQVCTWDSTLAVAPIIAPHVRYVMRNIYVVNMFFTTYYTALSFATSQAQLAISAIVNKVNPPKEAGIPWFQILTALSFGLAFLGAPTIALSLLNSQLGMARSAIPIWTAQSLMISLQQAPGVGKALMPTGTADSKFIQIGQLETQLGGATNELKGVINAAVEKLMTDMPTFVKFVESGKYSGDKSYSLPNQTVGLDIALKTYIVSNALKGNSWWAGPSTGPYEREEFPGLNENNVQCDDSNYSALYWSPDTKRSYQFNGGGTNQSPCDMAAAMVENQWAPLNILFDGAWNCTRDGHAGTNNINFNFDGSLNVACISALPMLTSCGAPCPSPMINGTCPFGDYGYLIGC